VSGTRRDFLAAAASASGALLFRGVPMWAQQRSADWVLRGAIVYDGAGLAPVEADVAISGDRIEAVGPRLSAAGARELDLRGLALAPGFIDIHSHSDLVLLVDPKAQSKIRQGVTTEVAGQDGGSVGPWGDAQFQETRDAYRSRYGIEIDFRDLAGFFARLKRQGAAVNLASMVGHGTLHAYAVGASGRPATEAERVRMAALVTEALAAGACGVSSGLEYLPGAFADLDELAAVAAPLKGTGLPYATHLRNEDDQSLAALEEALNVGRKSGAAVHISHLKAQGERNWWKAPVMLELFERARAGGLDVTYDCYPYVAYATGLSNMFPVWAREGGTDAFLARLKDPEQGMEIKVQVLDKVNQLGNWDAIQISNAATVAAGSVKGRPGVARGVLDFCHARMPDLKGTYYGRTGEIARDKRPGIEAWASLVRLAIALERDDALKAFYPFLVSNAGRKWRIPDDAWLYVVAELLLGLQAVAPAR